MRYISFRSGLPGLILTYSCIGHVLCNLCFQGVLKNPPYLCPFRCGAMPDDPPSQRRLKTKDGKSACISLKKAEPLSDVNAAIEKSVTRSFYRQFSSSADRWLLVSGERPSLSGLAWVLSESTSRSQRTSPRIHLSYAIKRTLWPEERNTSSGRPRRPSACVRKLRESRRSSTSSTLASVFWKTKGSQRPAV